MIDFLGSTLLAPERIEASLGPFLAHRETWADRRQQLVIELREQADEAERKLRNLYEAVEDGMLTSTDRMFRERIAELSTLRDRAEIEADRVEAIAIRTSPVLAMKDAMCMASQARAKLHKLGSPPRQIVLTLLQRVDVASKLEAHVKGSRGGLLKAFASATGNRAIMTAGAGGLNWDWGSRDGMEDAYAFCMSM